MMEGVEKTVLARTGTKDARWRRQSKGEESSKTSTRRTSKERLVIDRLSGKKANTGVGKNA
jgi:hypothetical protein